MSLFTDQQATGVPRSMALERAELVAALPAFASGSFTQLQAPGGTRQSYDLHTLVQF